jgi:16S rRNA (uracil1498-N3)-methyltransferase
LVEELPSSPPDRITVALVQALPAPRKVDEVVEKGTEVGVDWFLVVPSAGSPLWSSGQREERIDRWKRIAKEAAKQSRQLAVPRVEAPTSPAAARVLLAEAGFVSVVLAPDARLHLADALAESARGPVQPPSRRVALWVGPEGGWEPAEVDELADAGAVIATLGRRILRTETAGPVAAALARFVAGER